MWLLGEMGAFWSVLDYGWRFLGFWVVILVWLLVSVIGGFGEIFVQNNYIIKSMKF